MKPPRPNARAGFSLIEILISIAILSLVVAAIYSSWTAILRASKVGLEAAAAAQRSRVTMRKLEDSLTCAQMFTLNAGYYGFIALNGSEPTLSFVARVPQSFPRSGRFGDFDLRRLTYTVEKDKDGYNSLVLRQQPIIMDLDEDEKNFPLVLARNVKEFSMEFYDPRLRDWVDEWRLTNQLPKLILFTLRIRHTDSHNKQTLEETSRIVALPSAGVPQQLQVPNPPPTVPPGGMVPGVPGQPIPINPGPRPR
jgi:prepilin-type N-terminal cleavage/methylation domain-containing protein